MNLRIGCVEYINALPFSLPFQLGKIETSAEFVYAIPTQLNCLLREKHLDVALTSSVEYFDGDYDLLSDFGIAGFQKSLSVNLYTRFPLSSLNQKMIGLTHHSATSISLLKLLCEHLWKIEPYFIPLDRHKPFSDYAALLLIGDEALKNSSLPGFQTIDLATAWYQLTALPFVFAVFSVRKESPPENIALFKMQLEEALTWSATHRHYIEREALKRQSSLTLERIKDYYSFLRYRLQDGEMEGLKLFKFLRSAHVSKIGS